MKSVDANRHVVGHAPLIGEESWILKISKFSEEQIADALPPCRGMGLWPSIEDGSGAYDLCQNARASDATFSHDAPKLAVGFDDVEIRVLRLDAASDVANVVGRHRRCAILLKLLPDTRWIVSASRDGSVCILDVLRAVAAASVRSKV